MLSQPFKSVLCQRWLHRPGRADSLCGQKQIRTMRENFVIPCDRDILNSSLAVAQVGYLLQLAPISSPEP